jgi:hypothetical protein
MNRSLKTKFTKNIAISNFEIKSTSIDSEFIRMILMNPNSIHLRIADENNQYWVSRKGELKQTTLNCDVERYAIKKFI